MKAYSMYNNAMPQVDIIRIRNLRLLNLTVYGIVAIMIGLSLLILPDALTKAVATGLCVAFGLMHAFGFRIADTLGRLFLYFTVQAMIALALLRLSYPSDVFNLLFYILGLEAVMVFPERAAIAWIVGFYVVDSLGALLSRGMMGIINVLFYGAAFMLTAVFGYALRQAEIARRQNQRLLEELQASQSQLQDMAVMEERNRLAREMHDSLGHRLTVAVVQLEGAQRLIPTNPQRAAQMIGVMRDEMKEALAELRRTVSALRTPIPGDAPLEAAISTLSQTFQQNTGILTHFTVTPDFPALSDLYRLTFYRAAQEALTNIQRHAGAHNAWLQLSADGQGITLVMEDDGKGMDEHQPNGSGLGLLGLSERAAQLGGQIKIAERPGGGAQLTLFAPLPDQGVTP
jgi:signal transduction histidine kinase